MKLYMKYAIFFTLLIALIFVSCKSTEKSFTPTTFEGDTLTFGSFGGFAGAENKYLLLSNGQIFKYSRKDNGKEIDRVEKKQVEQIFKNIDNLKLRDQVLDDPGNLTHFMEIKDKDGTAQLKCGGGNVTPDPTLLVFYKNLWKIAEMQASPKG